MIQLDIAKYKQIVILTGAGISVASGLRPFRGPNGLWEELLPEEIPNAANARSNPKNAWKIVLELREKSNLVFPNKAHLAITYLQNNLSKDQRLTLITQNIDGLHQKAMSKAVIELHGSAFRTKCNNSECDLTPYEDSKLYDLNVLPTCLKCGDFLRPDLVLFDEALPAKEEHLSKRALRDSDLFIAIGTSGKVYPASNFVRSAKYVGAETILVNLEPLDPPNPAFDHEILGKAEEILPILFGL
jgi:NAD-dependent deacetylase